MHPGRRLNMTETSFDFSIEGDSEGYVTFECPYCGSEFKLQASEYQNDKQPLDELFCPYCGLTKDKNEFLSREVIEQAEAIIQNYLADKLNNAFKKMQKSLSKSGGIIKMTYTPLKKINVKDLKTKDTSEEAFECRLCHNHTKVLYCAGVSKVFCPYCGVDI